MTELEVLTIGRVSVDLYADEAGATFAEPQRFVKSVGGSPTNVAVAAARLGHRAAVITKVGDDPFGDLCPPSARASGRRHPVRRHTSDAADAARVRLHDAARRPGAPVLPVSAMRPTRPSRRRRSTLRPCDRCPWHGPAHRRCPRRVRSGDRRIPARPGPLTSDGARPRLPAASSGRRGPKPRSASGRRSDDAPSRSATAPNARSPWAVLIHVRRHAGCSIAASRSQS